jgi:hypothetical protein
MSICFSTVNAELPSSDTQVIDQQIKNADPFGFGKFLESRLKSRQDSGICSISSTRDLDGLCPKNCFYDKATTALEEAINKLKAIGSAQDFKKHADTIEKTIDCLQEKQKFFSSKLEGLEKELRKTHYVAKNTLSETSQDNISTQSITKTFKDLAKKIEHAPRKNIRGKAQDSLEYYVQAMQMLPKLDANKRVEAIQYLLKEANDSAALDGPIYNNKKQIIESLKAQMGK